MERVFERIGSGPLLLVAPSGAGKSSLLGAGLVPAFRRPSGFPMPGADRWPVIRLTPTAHPLEELLDRTAKVLGADPGIGVREVRERPGALLDAVRRQAGPAPAAGVREPPPVRPVLIVDQFEELFTLCCEEEERRAFVRVLSALSGPGSDAPAVVVLGLRADFSGSALELPELAAAFAEGLFVLPPMSVDELREAITRPAELAGVALEPGLVPLVLQDAGLSEADAREVPAAREGGSGASGAAPGGAEDRGGAGRRDDAPAHTPSGALPLISHALLTTWQQRTGPTLTVAGYAHTGGIRGAIARTAEDAFALLYPAEQRTIRRILVRLVHVADGTGATRRRLRRTALLAQLADAERVPAALDAFVRARLVTLDRDTVEITHEALLHAWPRLRGWISADRAGLLVQQQLSHAAAEWEREGRDPSALYRGSRLEAALARAEEAHGLDGRTRLGPLEEAFLRESRAAQQARVRQARRQARLRQGMLATLVVLLVLAVGAGVLAYQQRAGALGQERVARSRALALQSASMAAGQPERSMLLAAEAYRTAPTAEARGALLSTQAQPFVARLGGHAGPVNAVAFAPDGRTLATGSSDGTVVVQRVADDRSAVSFRLAGRVRAVSFSPDGRTLAAASTGGPVRLWDTAGRRTAAVLPAATTGARAVAFAPDGSTLAVPAADGTVRLWRTAGDHGPAGSLAGHAGRVDALAWAPDGRTLVSAGADRTVRLWDPAAGGQLAALEGHSDEVLGVAFAPDGRTVATGGVDRTVRLWDVTGRRATAVLTGHSDDVNGVAFTPDGTTVVSAGGDGTTRLWDVGSGRPTATLAGHTDYVLGVAVDPAGGLLATAGFDQSVVLWDLRGGVLTSRPFAEVWHAAYSPDGALLATAETDRTVRLWDVARRRVVAAFGGYTETVYTVAFSPDGRTLASAGSDGTVRLWDPAAPSARPAVLDAGSGTVFAVAFSPDGRTLAAACADGTVRLWDPVRRRQLGVLTGHTDFVNDVAFSPDGRTVVSGGDDLTVRLWDVAGQRQVAALSGHTGAVRGVVFSPDGRTVASSGNDGTVRLWDARTHRFEAALSGHTGSARGLAFSPDGRTLASSGNDRTVRLWDVAARRPVAALAGHANAVWSVAFSPDGRTVASGSTDGTVRLWSADVGARLTAVDRLRSQVRRWR